MSNTLLFGCLAIFGTMFTTTFLRGMQNKNVAGGHKRLAAVFGFAMAMCDIVTISLVGGVAVAAASSGDHSFGIYTAIAGGTGSAIGWVLSMVIHDRVMRRRNEAREAEKKLRKRSKQEERIRSILRDELEELESNGIITINQQ